MRDGLEVEAEMSPATAGHDGSPTRRAQVLGELRSADEPLGVIEVAHRLGVHANTARFHLDGLVTHEFPLSQINEAIGVVRSGEGGRVIVRMD